MTEYYYRQVRFGPGAPSVVVRNLLIANIAVFAIQLVFYYFPIGGNPFYLYRLLGLNTTTGVLHGYVWQFITYMFMHSLEQPLHIVFNMLYLWMFGVEVERAMGSRSFAWMYFICGLAAGLFTCLVIRDRPTIGASGAVFGVMLAYGLLFPERIILMFFVLPVKAIYMVMFMVAAEVLYMITRSGGNVAHVTHVSGALFAYLYLRHERKILAIVPDRGTVKRVTRAVETVSEAEQQRRIDAILDKINREGMHRLTPAERQFLRSEEKKVAGSE